MPAGSQWWKRISLSVSNGACALISAWLHIVGGRIALRGDPVDEACDRFQHRIGLIAVRRMPAVLELQQFDVPHLRTDAPLLLHGSIFVVLALDSKNLA